MDAHTLTTSTWGKNSTDIDVRALRRYQKILRAFSSFGEWASFALAHCVLIAIVLLILLTNFENVIFYDGTDMTCVLNGATGEIYNVK